MYNKHYSTRTTPQSRPIPGKQQVKNNAGGYVFGLDDWARLRRFLILGTEGGTYYQKEAELTVEACEAVRRCIVADGARVIKTIIEVSDGGLAPKNEPVIFALAMATKFGDDLVRRAAFDTVPKVCRIGTHLFQFAAYRESLGGWGRGMRRAVAKWYLDKDIDTLALQLTKYQQRNGWSQRDLLRLSHPTSNDPLYNRTIGYAVGKVDATETGVPLIVAVEKAKRATKPQLIKLITDHKLHREHIPTEYLSDPDVQWAYMQHMPIGGLIRNLGNFSKSGLLKPLSNAEAFVCFRLSNTENLQRSRVHPFSILLALKTYESGAGFRGTGSWVPCPAVIDALDDAFYEAFTYTEGSGKKFLLGIDVSGSMASAAINNTNITAREAAAAMAMCTLKAEAQVYAHGFSHTFVDLKLSKKMRLDTVVKHISGLPFSSTDCALPMMHALKYKLEVDTFVVYTDNETWSGNIHPDQALDRYRQATGRAARLVTCAFTSSGFTIADPNDAGMLDCVGLDASLPSIITQFSAGNI